MALARLQHSRQESFENPVVRKCVHAKATAVSTSRDDSRLNVLLGEVHQELAFNDTSVVDNHRRVANLMSAEMTKLTSSLTRADTAMTCL